WLAGMVLSRYGPADGDNDAGTDEAGDQITDPAAERDAEQSENQAGQNRSDDAENDIHQHAPARLHEHAGKPAGNAADNDGRQPTHAVKSHLFLLVVSLSTAESVAQWTKNARSARSLPVFRHGRRSERPDEHEGRDRHEHDEDGKRQAEPPIVAEAIAAGHHDQRVALVADGGEEVAAGADGHRHEEGFGAVAQPGGENGGD